MPDTCVMTADPTPNQTIAFKVMIHDIHYARKREGLRRKEQPGAAGQAGDHRF